MELWIGLGVAAVVVIFVISIYNRMVTSRNTMTNALKQIDVILKQRHEMIPNLVETVKGYASHERATLEEVIKARNNAESARQKAGETNGAAAGMAALGQAEGLLGQALGKMFALSEAYPDLKAAQNFRDLQDQLVSIDTRVAASRRGYNNSVLDYNNTIQIFPNNIVAGMFRFERGHELEFDDAAAIKEAPKVSFS